MFFLRGGGPDLSFWGVESQLAGVPKVNFRLSVNPSSASRKGLKGSSIVEGGLSSPTAFYSTLLVLYSG
jgi:hypothetical protein